MNSHRRLITAAALLAAAALGCAPAGAQASSLLSGYGGPGQGSQALLGSTLIGGGGGGGGGGASGGGGATGSERSGGSIALAVAPAQGQGTTSGKHARHTRIHGSAPASAPGRDTGQRAALRFHETGAGSSTLGLSAMDLVYILAVLGGLVLIALFMRGATRGARPGAPD